MSYSYKKSTAKDEEDLKEYQTKATATEKKEEPKTLRKALDKKDIDLAVFANASEEYRKRVLKDDYDEFKERYGWLYDQPIKS